MRECLAVSLPVRVRVSGRGEEEFEAGVGTWEIVKWR